MLEVFGNSNLWNLLGVLLSLALGFLGIFFQFRILLGRKKHQEIQSYSQRLATITKSLSKASIEVNNLLNELTEVVKNREAAVQDLETVINSLQDREVRLETRIKDLQNIPIKVAEHFTELAKKNERRTVVRDYVLFGLGVIVSTIITIAFKLLGLD